MTTPPRVSPFDHPLALGSLRAWLRLVREAGGVDREFLGRALYVTATALLSSPLRLYERLRHGPAVRRVALHPAPIFIVGHWRTGTTHLHNLLCQDPAHGYVSTFQALAPGFCLSGDRLIKPLIARIVGRTHPTRLIDNIPLSLDAPQEDEFGLMNLSSHSCLHSFTFPRRAGQLFERYALAAGLKERALAEWTASYLDLLRKATLLAGGRRLVIKNPANAGRLRQLLALFPEARFIYTVRDPYRVFTSLLWVYGTIVPMSQVQHVDQAAIEHHVLHSSARLMERFLADRALIPPGHLVQVQFEDLEREPLDQLRAVYRALDLPGFAAAEPAMRAYLASIDGYQKNIYAPAPDVVDRVNRHWGSIFEPWGYTPLLGP